MDEASIYNYEYSQGKLILEENTSLTSVKRSFDNSYSSQELTYISGQILAIQSHTLYEIKKYPKKDSGKITFVNKNDKKDRFDAEFSIKREEQSTTLSIAILTGPFKDKTITINQPIDRIELIEK